MTNRIKLARGAKVHFPLASEILEKKAKLSLKIFEENEVKLQISADELYDWLKDPEETQQYPSEQRRYMIFHRSGIWVVCNEFVSAELEYTVEWLDVVVQASGTISGEYALRETAEPVGGSEDSEKEMALAAELDETKRTLETYEEIVNQYMLESFHENGTYVEKLKAIERSLKEGEAVKAFQEWKRKQEELENQKKKMQEDVEAQKRAYEKKKSEVEAFEKELEKHRKGLETLDKLNEETLKKLEESSERLKLDQEILEFVENHNIDVEAELKNVEEVLKKTEKMIREAIVLKEKKIEKIQDFVRGDSGN